MLQYMLLDHVLGTVEAGAPTRSCSYFVPAHVGISYAKPLKPNTYTSSMRARSVTMVQHAKLLCGQSMIAT